MSALTRLGSVNMPLTLRRTVAVSSLSRIALPMLLLIFPWPSVPTRVGTSPTSASGTGRVSPYSWLKRRAISRVISTWARLSLPTGTIWARTHRMSAACRIG